MRLSYLDNLKTFLTIFVVIFHTSIAYGAAGSWIYTDSKSHMVTATVILLTNFVLVGQSFGLSLFFFISTYFVPWSCDRKGIAKFTLDRLLRIGVPMLIYYFIIGPTTIWFSNDRMVESLSVFYLRNVLSFHSTFFGPTWFLEALIYFAIIYSMFRQIMNKLKIPNLRRINFPSHYMLLLLAVGFGMLAFLIRLVYPVGTGPLELQLGYFPLYTLAMIAGVIAYRNHWLENLPDKLIHRWVVVAFIATPMLPVALILTGALHGVVNAQGGWHIQALFYALWEPFLCFGFGLGLLRLFQHRFDKTTRLSKFASNHAYAVYVIHPPVVVGFTMLFHQAKTPEIIKFVIVAPLSVIACFLLASFVRKVISTIPGTSLNFGQ